MNWRPVVDAGHFHPRVMKTCRPHATPLEIINEVSKATSLAIELMLQHSFLHILARVETLHTQSVCLVTEVSP